MKLRWKVSAVSDLANIRDYISADSPSAARAVVDRVVRSVERLRTYASAKSRVRCRARIVYTHDDRSVDIVAIFHGAQKRG